LDHPPLKSVSGEKIQTNGMGFSMNEPNPQMNAGIFQAKPVFLSRAEKNPNKIELLPIVNMC